jgi:hypothetical protein
MTKKSPQSIVDLTAVIVAVTENVPRVLLVESGAQATGQTFALPNGPFDPGAHESLENGLRSLVEAQTGLDLRYVEQLYTFGNRYRDERERGGGPRVISVAYIALTHEDAVDEPNATWHDWYQFLPWEDWRAGAPTIISERIAPALQHWVRNSQNAGSRRHRQERVNVTFGQHDTDEMDSVLCPERYELLYETGLAAESSRDQRSKKNKALEMSGAELGVPLASDHRRILATALGRLRGKLAYRPVVFELLPGEFTLLHLQRVVEALSGAELHKQNFRRLVTNADLVESIGRNSALGRGRPAELFRFRREVLGEKLTVGLSRPMLRGS